MNLTPTAVQVIMSMFAAYTVGMTAFVAFLKKDVMEAREEIKAIRKEYRIREDRRDESDRVQALKVEDSRLFANRVFDTLDKFHYLVMEMVRAVRKGDDIPKEILDEVSRIPTVADMKRDERLG